MKLIKVGFVVLFGFQLLFAATARAQGAGSEVFLFKILEHKGSDLLLDRGKNITKNPGYDNQPSFSFNSDSILYVSSRRGKATDVYEYSLRTGRTVRITSSVDGEYSPRALDANTITFIREGKGQEMTVWKYDRATKKESLALHIKEPIGYYAWNYKGDALVWVRYAFMARWVNSKKGINEFVMDHVVPSIPQNILGTSKFSFMHRQANDDLWIKEFDPITRSIRPIVKPKDEKKNYCWMTDGSLLIGSGSKLYRFDAKTDKDWVMVADLQSFGIKDITRMAVSFDGKSLALVSNQ
jgi:hypothetical protein